jgi:Domain of unknown function (DUF3883)
MMITLIRQSLLNEARNSPALLSDIAGLEEIVAESYNSRSFIELLQNADDAGASRFAIHRSGDSLLVANDGHPFTGEEFQSLCRSGYSSKHRGTSIGYRGIGFKSVVGFAAIVHLLSGKLAATFSRRRTAQEIPQETRVPLIRIPHPLLPLDYSTFAKAVDALLVDGFNTVFVFGGLLGLGLETEFAAFDPTSLLFLRNVRQVELRTTADSVITVERGISTAGAQSLRLASPDGLTEWKIFERDGIALALMADESGIARLDEHRAVVHAFLPTHEPTGFPFKLHGDFSTDPSRTRIVFDERTLHGVAAAASLVIELLQQSLAGGEDVRLAAALVPTTDPRIATFQKRSFRTEFYTFIQRAAGDVFTDVFCRPIWLNPLDFETLAKGVSMRVISRRFEAVDGVPAFLKFLGAQEAKFRSIASALETTSPSNVGAAELVVYLTNLYSTGQVAADALHSSWRIWEFNGGIGSLKDAKTRMASLAPEFVEQVTAKTSRMELARMLVAMTDAKTAERLLPAAPSVVNSSKHFRASISTERQISLKRWRGAEQQVLTVLAAWGWNLEDVSRQNIGYDIEGQTPEGDNTCIEVKALDYPGQPFTLTSNEEAVARQKGNAYRLALVRQTNTHLEIAFIADPTNHLQLTRQCRQWVWECASYPYSPEKFAFE